MRFVPRVDLPVSVETAGVSQQLPALLALHTGLPIRTDFPRLNTTQRVFLCLELGSLVLVLIQRRGQTDSIGPPGVGEELTPQSFCDIQTPREIQRGGAANIRQVNQKISVLIFLTRVL